MTITPACAVNVLYRGNGFLHLGRCHIRCYEFDGEHCHENAWSPTARGRIDPATATLSTIRTVSGASNSAGSGTYPRCTDTAGYILPLGPVLSQIEPHSASMCCLSTRECELVI